MTDAKVLSLAAAAAAKGAEGGQPSAKLPPTLNPSAPYDNAGAYIDHRCIVGGQCILWHWQGEFYRWGGRIYEAVPDDVMRGQVYSFLDSARRRSGDEFVRFQPTPRHVNEVIDSLKSRLALGIECQPPLWLGTRGSANDWIVFENKIVNVLTEEARELTPDLWVHSSLRFAWDPDAECPTWETFLAQVFPNANGDGVDEESVQFLEEFMGYCMTEETKFQKGAMLIGPKRAGKGTISRVLQQLVGDASYVGLSFNTWIQSENSKECLIGKRVGVFADVRFKPGKQYGANYDPGGITHTSAEFLLNVIGEDTVTIGRKYRSPWHGQLRLKLMLISNEVPNLNDSSGVLPSRFIKLHFPVSFYGKEDVNLKDKLRAELSGIAVRCVRAYGDLCARGQFIQPASATALEREILTASDPFSAMAQACFAADFEGRATRESLVSTAHMWLGVIGRPDEAARVRSNNIIARLKSVPGFEHIGPAPRVHGATRTVAGVRVRPHKEWKESL
jgi:putative DNA primase/helicase